MWHLQVKILTFANNKYKQKQNEKTSHANTEDISSKCHHVESKNYLEVLLLKFKDLTEVSWIFIIPYDFFNLWSRTQTDSDTNKRLNIQNIFYHEKK